MELSLNSEISQASGLHSKDQTLLRAARPVGVGGERGVVIMSGSRVQVWSWAV